MLIYAYPCVLSAISAAPVNEEVLIPRFGAVARSEAAPADYERMGSRLVSLGAAIRSTTCECCPCVISRPSQRTVPQLVNPGNSWSPER